MQEVKQKAIELLQSGTVSRVLGWKAGEFFYDLTPASFESAEEVKKDFVFGPFCGANFSKYLITAKTEASNKSILCFGATFSYWIISSVFSIAATGFTGGIHTLI